MHFIINVNQGLKMAKNQIFLTKQRRDAMIASDLNFPNDCIKKQTLY